MAKDGVLLVLAATLLLGVAAQQPQSGCGECDSNKCPPTEDCPGAEAMDACGCCLVCERSLGQRCDLRPAAGVKYGPCGSYMVCRARDDISGMNEATCQCVQQTEVCGTDDITYETLCHLLIEAKLDTNLTVKRQQPCPTKPVIKTAPQSSQRHLGGILVLDCEVAGFPVPAITWELYRRDGSTVKLPNDDSGMAVQIRGGPEPHMVTGWVQIMKITRENVGTYVCNAENSEGQAKGTALITYFGAENEL